MEPRERNTEARKLLKNPYEVLGIGYKQFERSQSFVLKYSCFVGLIVLCSLSVNLMAGPKTTG